MFRHAVILGPSFVAPLRGDEVGNAARVLLALKRAGARTALVTSVDASAPTGALAADELFLGGCDAASLMALLDRLRPDILFWLPGGPQARDIVSAIEQTGFFLEAGIELVPRPERLRRIEDPDHLAQLVRPLELTVPEHRVVADAAQLRGAVKALSLPVSVRPLGHLTSAPWTSLRDEHDLGRMAEIVPSHRHWVVRRTPLTGLTLDVVVAADRQGHARALGAVRHCEPWLADAGHSTIYASCELSLRPDVVRLAEHACEVAGVLDVPGLVTVRLCADAAQETCAVLDVMMAPGPACWTLEIISPLPLHDVAVALASGLPLSAALPRDQPSEASATVAALPRVSQTATLDAVPVAYLWAAGSSPRAALRAVLDATTERLWPGPMPARPQHTGEAIRLAGPDKWVAALRERDAGVSLDVVATALGLEPDVAESFLGGDRSEDEAPWVAPARTNAQAAPPSTLLLVSPLGSDLCADEHWAAVQAAEALRARGHSLLTATTSLPLAGLMRELGLSVMSPTLAADGLAGVGTRLGLARVLPIGRVPAWEVLHALQSVGIATQAGTRVPPPIADRQRAREALESDRSSRVPVVRATNVDDAIGLVEQQGWPVFVSTSSVPHADMVIGTRDQLMRYCRTMGVSAERPVWLACVPKHARILEVEALCSHGRPVLAGWSEHVEGIGSTSRLSLAILPPQRTYPEQLRRGRALLVHVAALLDVDGPLSLRLVVTENDVRVLSTAAGSTRQWPLLSRALGIDWADCWASLACGEPWPPAPVLPDSERISLSLRRLPSMFGQQTTALAPSPASLTVLGDDADEVLLRALWAAGLRRPVRSVWLSAATVEDRISLIRPAKLLRGAGVRVNATDASAACLRMNDVDVTTMTGEEGRDGSSPARRRVDLVVAVSGDHTTDSDESRLARFAQASGIPLIEDVGVLQRMAEALVRSTTGPVAVRSWNDDQRRVQQWA